MSGTCCAIRRFWEFHLNSSVWLKGWLGGQKHFGGIPCVAVQPAVALPCMARALLLLLCFVVQYGGSGLWGCSSSLLSCRLALPFAWDCSYGCLAGGSLWRWLVTPMPVVMTIMLAYVVNGCALVEMMGKPGQGHEAYMGHVCCLPLLASRAPEPCTDRVSDALLDRLLT